MSDNTRRLTTILADYKKTHNDIINNIARRKISADPTELEEIESILTEHFNDYTLFAARIWNSRTPQEKNKLQDLFLIIRNDIARIFQKLNIDVVIPQIVGNRIISFSNSGNTLSFASISNTGDTNSVEVSGTETTNPGEIRQEEHQEEHQEEQQGEHQGDSGQEEDSNEDHRIKSEQESIQEQRNMTPMPLVDFYKFGMAMIQPYDGSPEKLENFIKQVELFKKAADGHLESDILEFARTRMEQKAKQALPESVSTVEELRRTMTKNIRPIHSKIIKSKIATLRMVGQQVHEFAAKAEELADQLQQALVLETNNVEMAQDMTVDAMINLCRANARTEIQREIMGAIEFKTPKAVLMKFIMDFAGNQQEKAILAFNQQHRGRGGGPHYNSWRGAQHSRGGNYYRGGYQGNRGFRPNYNRRRGYYQHPPQQQQITRGGGNFRGNDNRGRSHIRYAEIEEVGNLETPQIEYLGEESTN